MSLGIAFKGPEGIVLAADSRVTLMRQDQVPGGIRLLPATFDNATKLLRFDKHNRVGAVTYGLGAIGGMQPRTAHSFLPEFEEALQEKLDQTEGKEPTIQEYAQYLSDFFMERWKDFDMPTREAYQQANGEPMIFIVAGYNEGEAYGRVYDFALPHRPEPVEQNPGDFGVTWGGQGDPASRLLNGYDTQMLNVLSKHFNLDGTQLKELAQVLQANARAPIPYQFLPLQDCVDFATFIIRTTMELQTFTVDVRGVGGAIDIATITRTEGFTPVEQKKITAKDFRKGV